MIARAWRTAVALMSIRVHLGGALLGTLTAMTARAVGLDGMGLGMTVWAGCAILAAIGAATGSAHLNCPACGKMVKMGASRCHHCSSEGAST